MLGEAGDMTRDAGASRTFRSIFGAGEEDAKARAAPGDEGDDALWSDEEREGERADNNADAAAPNKSMAEWAEDEDDEEVWKDALQARVNQLELVLQARESDDEDGLELPPDGALAFANVLRPAAAVGDAKRHKVQRVDHASSTKSTSSCSSATLPPPSPQSGARKKRPSSKDFIARNIQAVELKRSVSGESASSRTDSPSSAGPTARLRRKGSAELALTSPTSTTSTANSGRGRGGGEGRRGSRRTSVGPVFNLSETEAIRRFVVSDIKQMSMERLVNNAKRLHFLEEFYTHHSNAASATSSTGADPPLSPSSERSDPTPA